MTHLTCFFAPKQKHPSAPQDWDVGSNSCSKDLRAYAGVLRADVVFLCGADVVFPFVDVDFLGVLGDGVMVSCEPKVTKVSDFAQFQKCEECIFGAWQQIELLILAPLLVDTA